MSLIDRLQRLERMDALIRRKATGNPRQLADRFGVSPRSVANILDELRQLGAEIEYCRYRNSYFYRQPIRFQFNLVVSERDSDKIAGGSKKTRFFGLDAKFLPGVRLSLSRRRERRSGVSRKPEFCTE